MASLQDLGLSPYEASAYQTLLQTGPTTAKTVSAESGVPMGRIYDVLNALEAQRLVRSQPESRPTRYAAVEPRVALERLLERRRSELTAQEASYERIAAELQTELGRSEPIDAEFWTAAVGQVDAPALYADRLAGASDEIRLVIGRPIGSRPAIVPAETVTTAVVDARERGVTVDLLLAETLRERVDESRLERWLAASVAVRSAENLRGRYGVIDDRECCLAVPHPLAASELVGLLAVTDRAFAGRVRREIGERWDDAASVR